MEQEQQKVKCPFCGYEMPVWYGDQARCQGVQLKCKRKECRKEFEVVIDKGKQCSR